MSQGLKRLRGGRLTAVQFAADRHAGESGRCMALLLDLDGQDTRFRIPVRPVARLGRPARLYRSGPVARTSTS